MYREYVSCPCNSSYRFKPILLKLLQVLLGWAEDTFFRFLKLFCYFFRILTETILFSSPNTIQVYTEHVPCPCRIAEGHCFRLSVVHCAKYVVRGSGFLVLGTVLYLTLKNEEV